MRRTRKRQCTTPQTSGSSPVLGATNKKTRKRTGPHVNEQFWVVQHQQRARQTKLRHAVGSVADLTHKIEEAEARLQQMRAELAKQSQSVESTKHDVMAGVAEMAEIAREWRWDVGKDNTLSIFTLAGRRSRALLAQCCRQFCGNVKDGTRTGAFDSVGEC